MTDGERQSLLPAGNKPRRRQLSVCASQRRGNRGERVTTVCATRDFSLLATARDTRTRHQHATTCVSTLAGEHHTTTANLYRANAVAVSRVFADGGRERVWCTTIAAALRRNAGKHTRGSRAEHIHHRLLKHHTRCHTAQHNIAQHILLHHAHIHRRSNGSTRSRDVLPRHSPRWLQAAWAPGR